MISRIVISIFFLIATIFAEFYSSLASLKAIIGAKNDIAVIINEVQERNDKAIQGGEEAIRHPVNAFLLIKRMTANWNKAVKIMQNNSADDTVRNMFAQRAIKHINYPTEEDLLGAVIAGDCFEIGRVAYKANDYYHTIMWMQEARERVEKEIIPTANLEDILEYLAFSLYKQGNLKRALLLTDEFYRMNPNRPLAKASVKWYEDLLEDRGVQSIDMRRNIPSINNERPIDLDEGAMLMYEALCRQEVPLNTKIQSQLYCYYKMDRPYLRLAPFKVEIVRQNPLVVLFYDIVSDEESRIIEMLATPKARLLERPLFRNRLTGKYKPTIFRVSQNARLSPMEHEIFKHIDRSLELATNLDLETAENIMTHNYGIGGHYEPHIDCLNMTEPEIGGRTVFTSNPKISVPCTKNAALFWYNLMRTGEIDMRSRHAACPVLTGIKWAVTKWFRERGQEWSRPCGLSRFDQERYVGDLGAPEPKNHLNIRSETDPRKNKH
ncbi:Prolyl 4-hydroxylase subunit alpha-1 [Dirofilaria immitis]|nr:Prolyl 4-hydroxylase subunit alpha-1 [Dirofilaria immitis]